MIEASSRLEGIPDDIILTFTPEVTIFDAVTTQYIRTDRDDEISMSEIDTMIKKIEYESLERARDRSKKQYGIVHDDIRLISSTITSITIDGKSVTNPLGFSGSQIRIRVLNVFSPSSEFNILRSIITSLGKRMISVVPTPLLFSKIIERSEYVLENNLSVDIGYMHTTLVLESRNEITAFETFPFWTKMLLENLARALPEKTYLEIESYLFNADSQDEKTIPDEEIGSFLHYVSDVILAFLSRQKEDITVQNIFLSWGIFSGEKYRSIFYDTFHTSYKSDIRMLEFSKILEKKKDPDTIMCYSLAILAEELLVVKKDPLIRILRYVLYNYE